MVQVDAKTLMAMLCAGLIALASSARAQAWFPHPFGELRSFHKDWLAVCEANGAGPCRLVRAAADEGSDAFFDQRLTLCHGEDGWWIEVMDRGMPEADLTQLIFRFAQREFALDASHWAPGERQFETVVETVTIKDRAVVDPIIDAMRAGLELEIAYRPAGSGDGRLEIPLRGFSAAMDAVIKQEEEKKR